MADSKARQSAADAERERYLGLLRRIVSGWHQSGSAEVWAADALQEAADLVEQERRAAEPPKEGT